MKQGQLPEPPLPESDDPPLRLDPCVSRPTGLTVLPPCRSSGTAGESASPGLSVDLVNANPLRCFQAYARIREMAPVDLGHHYPGWGLVYFAVVLPRVGEREFAMPHEESAEKVAVKRLSKAAVEEFLARGGHENPFREIQRMQWLGDNQHVLGIVEALHDEDYLYIVMPYCEGGSLVRWIFGDRDRIGDALGGSAAVYHNLLENIEYLHRHGVCHRDFSPDNCMVLKNHRIVLNDLAMSFRMPPGDLTATDPGGGFFGKPAYLPPEVVSGYRCFSASGCDLWGTAVVLFNLVTGEVAWRESLPTDLRFRYLVLAGGLSSSRRGRSSPNERAAEVLADDGSGGLRSLAEKCLDLNPLVSDLLEGVLRLDPNERWETRRVKSSLWLEAFRQLG
ncbi:unnamed protein product [Pseudo-nitzschia multistriata]|uniref:Protein kinase domain-containing protein n=1 Tax=Pseudo-nitzschia multistriata TaxID=183589 RepID=A0A448ZSQ3_9STRA|nr:unnamed protein product [Pseudo-nitzschia multistriata]